MASDNKSIFFVIPNNTTILSITLNGFNVPIKDVYEEDIEGITYKVYETYNKYVAGNYQLVINGYSTSEAELIAEIGANVNRLNEDTANLSENINSINQDIDDINQDVTGLDRRISSLEDTTSTSGRKNKKYAPAQFSGLGEKYLDKNMQPLGRKFNGFVSNVDIQSSALTDVPDAVYFDRVRKKFVAAIIGGTEEEPTYTYYDSWADVEPFYEENGQTKVRNVEYTNPASDYTDPYDTTVFWLNDSGEHFRFNEDTFDLDRDTVIRPNVNILTQDMITDDNTIYHIEYDFDLNGKTIEVPEGCVLQFEGGSLRNGTLVGESTVTKNFKSKCKLSGTFTEDIEIDIYNDEDNSDDTFLINNIIEHFVNSTIIFKESVYRINGNYYHDRVSDNHVGLNFCKNNQYIFNGTKFKQVNNTDQASRVMFINRISGVVFENFTIEGDLLEHEIISGTTDEQNYGLVIGPYANNITVQNVKIYNFTGDCINTYDYSHNFANIVVKNSEFSGARRGCISIENINGLTIDNCKFIKSSDVFVFPDFFIDIEPLSEYHNVVDHVKIINNTFYSEKQIHIGLLVYPTYAESVLNLEISGNYFYGNPPINGYLNFASGYIVKEKLICKDNILKVTSDEYPLYQWLGELVNVANGADVIVDNLYVEGYISGTIGPRIWGNNAKCVFNNCTFKNCRIETGRDGDTDSGNRPTSIFNNCIVSYDISNTSVFYSVYKAICEIHNCDIVTQGKSIITLDSTYKISNSKIKSKTSVAIDCSLANARTEEEAVVGLYIENCTIESGGNNNVIGGSDCLSIVLKNSVLSGNKGIEVTCNKRNNTYYDTVMVDECEIKTFVSGVTSNANYVSKFTNVIFSKCTLKQNQARVYFTTGDPTTFSDCTIIGVPSNSSPMYSDNYTAFTYLGTTINGNLIKNTSDTEETYGTYTSAPISGASKIDASKKIPMWWNANQKRWENADGFPGEALRRGNSSNRPKGTGATGGVLNATRDIGFMYFDTALNKAIYAKAIANDGTVTWVDALGNPVTTVYPKVVGTPVAGNLAKFNSTITTDIEDAGIVPQS